MKAKWIPIWVISKIRLDRLVFRCQNLLYGKKYIRSIFYHDTPPEHASMFEEHMKFLKKHYYPVSLLELRKFLNSGEWDKDKPGLLISFDDGLRSNYDVAVPIMERYGFKGWHFVPSMVLDLEDSKQLEFGEQHSIFTSVNYTDHRIFLSLKEVKELEKRGHVIGSHTKTHQRMPSSTSERLLKEEIVDSKRMLEDYLGHDVESFCWVGGEEENYSKFAADLIRSTKYNFSFMTNVAPILPKTNQYQLNRTYVKCSWPYFLFSFQLSGIMDIYYAGKRKRVNRITAA